MHPISPETIAAYTALILFTLYGLYRWSVSDLAKWQRIIDEDDSRTAAGRVNNPYYFKQVDHE